MHIRVFSVGTTAHEFKTRIHAVTWAVRQVREWPGMISPACYFPIVGGKSYLERSSAEPCDLCLVSFFTKSKSPYNSDLGAELRRGGEIVQANNLNPWAKVASLGRVGSSLPSALSSSRQQAVMCHGPAFQRSMYIKKVPSYNFPVYPQTSEPFFSSSSMPLPDRVASQFEAERPAPKGFISKSGHWATGLIANLWSPGRSLEQACSTKPRTNYH